MKDNGKFTPIDAAKDQVTQEVVASAEHETRIKPGDVRMLFTRDEVTSETDQELLFTDEYPYKWLEQYPLVLVTSCDPETRSAEVVMVSGAYDGPWPRLLTDRDLGVGASHRIDSRTEDPIPEEASDLIVLTDISYNIGQEDLSSVTYGRVSKRTINYVRKILKSGEKFEPAWPSAPVVDENDPRRIFREAQRRIIEQVTTSSRARVENELKPQSTTPTEPEDSLGAAVEIQEIKTDERLRIPEEEAPLEAGDVRYATLPDGTRRRVLVNGIDGLTDKNGSRYIFAHCYLILENEQLKKPTDIIPRESGSRTQDQVAVEMDLYASLPTSILSSTRTLHLSQDELKEIHERYKYISEDGYQGLTPEQKKFMYEELAVLQRLATLPEGFELE